MANIDRSSSKHGPILDDEMKREAEGQLRAVRPTRGEGWHDPEPIEDENTPSVEEEIEHRRRAEQGRTASGDRPDESSTERRRVRSEAAGRR